MATGVMCRLSEALDAPGCARLEAGEVLFRAGEAVTKVYVLQSGAVHLERPLSHGEALVIHRCAPGELVAEASLFAPRYHCTAVADRDTLLNVYDRAQVPALLGAQPDMAVSLCRHLSSEIQALRTQLELAHIKSAHERVLTWLRLRAHASVVKIDRPLKTIAAEIGLAHETFYRVLRDLEDRRLIRREQGHIVLV